MSRKSQKKRTAGTKPLDRIKSRLKKEAPFQATKFVGHKPGDEKISEVVMRFVEPFTQDLETETQWKALIGIALIAWNASLLPPDERKAMMDEHFGRETIYRPEEAKRAVYELIERKGRYFSDYDQVLVSYDLTMTGRGPSLTVAFLKQRNREG
ncbi:MAG: hypothetical protein HY912_18970 [Desulfomonile tiedjei]|uniref:Uncharacterized protein n=1 Tax=Desulfomonile tiedjei TaxID=2358 RepID=A0A9D6Z1Y2_9BACT|nr:hypothetical protein [Desulfomonile tiedjei]